VSNRNAAQVEWWVTKADHVPVGPVSTELLLRGIGAGKVPKDALVCEVGGDRWRWIGETAPFSIAYHQGRRSIDDEDMTAADPLTTEDPMSLFDEAEQTTQTTVQLQRSWFESMNDSEERTLVDLMPLRPSEPPTDV
jgi:hypothetical protein